MKLEALSAGVGSSASSLKVLPSLKTTEQQWGFRRSGAYIASQDIYFHKPRPRFPCHTRPLREKNDALVSTIC